MPFEEHLEKIPRYLDEFEQKYRNMLRGAPKPAGLSRYEGPLHTAILNIKKFIWYEWLPGNIEYELGGDYFITDYCRSIDTEAIDYHCETWLPVRKLNVKADNDNG